MKIELNGKRVFVTAGGAGLGRATVLAMASLGAEVFTCDINAETLADLPEGVKTFVADVADSAQVDAIFDRILPGGLDILVNNAGVAGPTKLVEDVSNEEWRQCMAVCIDAQFYCVRRAVPLFKQQRHGVIINLVSAAGVLGYPTRSPYVAAKWAVTGFTQSLAMELGPDNIRVNGIVPGNVNGERMERVIHAHADAEGLEPEVVRRMYAIGTSMQCYVDAEEIADMICFLSSDYGRHVSGQIIGVDGNTETLYPRS
jgi:NAD(P)-dependent dehydrogenase (short-subunit alcohol dehydrogenase family)